MVPLEVGFEFSAVLPVYVNRFVPRRKELLDHISFRIAADEPLDRTPTEPWGLFDYSVTPYRLDYFLDQIIPEMLKSNVHRKPMLGSVLQLAYKRSQQPFQKDVGIYSLQLPGSNLL